MPETVHNALTAKRLGQYLMESGDLTEDQLEEALDRQRRMSTAGFHVLLGTILEEMGAIDRPTLETAILRQREDEGSFPEAAWSPKRRDREAAAEPVPSENGKRAVTSGSPAAEEAPTPVEPPVAPSGPSAESAISGPPAAESEPGVAVEAATAASADPASEEQVAAHALPEEMNGPAEPLEAVDVAERAPRGSVKIGNFNFHRVTNGLDEADVFGAITDLLKRAKDLEAQVEQDREGLAHLNSMRLYGEQTVKAADEVAAQIREEAEKEARQLRQQSSEQAEQLRQESSAQAEQLRQESSAQAEQLRRESTEQAERLLKESTDRAHQLSEESEKEAQQLRTDAERQAKQVRDEADKQAQAIRDRAQGEARRIIAEAKIREEEMLRNMGERVKRVSDEIKQNLAEHQEVNRRLSALAAGLMNPEEQEQAG